MATLAPCAWPCRVQPAVSTELLLNYYTTSLLLPRLPVGWSHLCGRVI